MRFPRPRSSQSSSSVSVSGTVSVVGSVKSTLKAKLARNKSGKYSQKITKRRGGSSRQGEKDLPKLADLVEEEPVLVEKEGREDVMGQSTGTNKIAETGTTGTSAKRDAAAADTADVEARDGPPEDDEAEPTGTATATETAAAAAAPPPATPKSPIIFGFHAVPSVSPALNQHRPRALSSTNLLQAVTQLITPTNKGHKRCQSWDADSAVVGMPLVPDTTTALSPSDVISPANSGESEYSATTALSIHSLEVEMCPKEKKGQGLENTTIDEVKEQEGAAAKVGGITETSTSEIDQIDRKENLKAVEAKDENSDSANADVEVIATEEVQVCEADKKASAIAKEDNAEENKPSGLTYITPSVLAATSSEYSANGELTSKLSMRSTVLVEDADDAAEIAEGETDNEDADTSTIAIDEIKVADGDDDNEDEGEDEYEEEGEYDGSLADESAEHVASPRNKVISPRNDTKKKRRSKVNEKRLRDGHRQACKYLKNSDFPRALEEFEGILDELMNSLGDSHRRVGSALHNVGIVNIRADNLDDAIDALEEAIRIRKDVHGPDHPKVADSLLELGIALLSQKDYEDALEIFNDALEIRENDLVEEARHGSDDDRIHCVLQVAKALNNIACVYFEYGSLSKALKTLEDVLEMQKEAIDELTERDPDYKQAKLSLATTYCNIGYVHADNADWDNAIEYLDRAYAVSHVKQHRYVSPF